MIKFSKRPVSVGIAVILPPSCYSLEIAWMEIVLRQIRDCQRQPIGDSQIRFVCKELNQARQKQRLLQITNRINESARF
jgi:hypothetical protein